MMAETLAPGTRSLPGSEVLTERLTNQIRPLTRVRDRINKVIPILPSHLEADVEPLARAGRISTASEASQRSRG